MKNEPKSSSIPLAIIVTVLIVVIGGAYWFYNSSKPASRNSNRAANASNTAKTPQPVTSAPLGAQPPNMLGSANAAVTVEEFADFQCAACAAIHQTMKEIQSTYGPRIRFIFRNYPLSIPAHNKAYEAAVAVEAAGLQDRNKFWAMQDQLFTNQKLWTENPNYRQLWNEYAQKIGLDIDRFQSDMGAAAAKDRVDRDLQRGRGLNVDSTPTIFINGRPVQFQDVNTASIRRIIDAEIQSTAGRNQPQAAAGNSGNAPAAGNATEGSK
ncbi:MAG: DsbA family protein [Pyrinomonadaceae bacterium]|nr:thioredoxin domain-containing protein [Blastocatellia bacterium]MDQ3221114.1 DsbA family protein [Acidobacteriota bacterium]MDQ3490571.1 DsbA family protein [Acidobacteriota bacterium]